MAGIINKTDHNHPEHAVYKAREKARAVEAEKPAESKPAEKPAETKTEPKK